MNVDSEVAEVIDLKLPSVSPTMQSDLSADGDTNTMQTASISNDKFSPLSQDAMNNEPKVKKRRKQSNPLKIENPTSPKFTSNISYESGDQGISETNEVDSFPIDDELQNQNHVIEKSRTPDYVSQKGTLSRVTNALYNNKLREAAKTSTNSSKSKESSLQSLTDISSPESSEEVMSSNNEYKNSMQNAYPQMPPLLPINPVDIARDTVKLGSVYPFSEFASPMQQGNMNLSVSQRSFITSNGVRVFNPEAYCELCEKEFCNKYFLKTHKANKHGICSVDNNTGGYSYKVSYKNMQMNPQAAQQMITQMCENGATFGSADSYCNICQKYFCNKYFLKKHRQNIHGIQEEPVIIPSSIHVPVISSPLPLVRPMSHDSKSTDNSAGQSTKDEDSKINVSIENIKNSLNNNIPLLNGSSPQSSQNKTLAQSINQKEKKSEKFLCELCNIEFCDKCYLDAHKLNKHGQTKIVSSEFPDFSEIGKIENNEKSSPSEDISEPKDNFKGQMCAPCMKNFTSAESFQYHMLEVHGASLKDDEDTLRTSDLIHKKNGQISFENECMMDTDDKSPSSQEMESSDSSTDSGSYNCAICLLKLRDKKSLTIHLESEHNILGSAALEMSLLQEGTTCDVCQEQFLDRIAVLSHKFKVHGIVPPGLEAYSDGIENGEYGFYAGVRQKSGGSSFCRFCNKELCNKYFMKTHMMKMHGIDVDKVQQERWPTAAGGGVYCDICQKFLCSKYFLKSHKQNVHGIMDDSAKLSMVGSPSYNGMPVNDKKPDWHSTNFSQTVKLNNNLTDSASNIEEAIKRNNNSMFICEICGQEFVDKIMLQFHLVNKHVKSSEGKVYPNSIPSPFTHSADDSKDALKGGVLPCSCCSFINLDDSSKLSQLNNPEVNMISCTICNVTYPQSDYHTHHLSHGISLPSGKKLPNLENGIHELGVGFGLSGNGTFDPNGDKLQPRKFKRFRCSKCDKTFRTKLRCLQHIQVMHKSRKGLAVQSGPQTPSKKNSLNNTGFRKNLEQKSTSRGLENGTGLIGGKEAEDGTSLLSSCFQDAAHLPVPYKLPKNSDVIMQPFHLSEPKPDGASKPNIFVPSLVYLPVSQKVSETLTVAFTLTPA